jgi:ABC-type Fe3+/spermidine/putrescine transport system ATPase subunit
MSARLTCTALACRVEGTTILRDLHLEVPAGSMTTVVGPSGAGKTTLLRTIAGLAPVTAGAIHLDDRDLTAQPVHRRRLAVVFQEPRLFTSMTVRDNVAFALRMAGAGRRARHARAEELLEEVGLASTGDRPTRGLSGGEAQRVALARALAGDPDLLLLDEPLSAVDPARREDLRRLIRCIQRDRQVTTLYVTHDRTEAAALGDRVALLIEGRIVQHAAPQDVFERPASAVVARFFGASNQVTGRVTAGRLRRSGIDLPVPGRDRDVTITLRPEHLHLADRPHPEDGQLSGVVDEVEFQGSHHRLTVDVDGLRVVAHVTTAEPPDPGEQVLLTLAPEHLWVLPDTPADRGSEAPAHARAETS